MQKWVFVFRIFRLASLGFPISTSFWKILLYVLLYLKDRLLRYVMGWSRPRLQTCQLSSRAGSPEVLVELSAVEVWTKPMADRGIYSYYNIATDFGWPNEFAAPPKRWVQSCYFPAPPKGWVQFSWPTLWFWSFCTALGHQLGTTFTQMIDNTTKNQ